MEVSERRRDGVTIIDVAGRLTVDEPGRLKEAVCKVVRRGETRLVLNLRGLTHVDSAGLGELISCYTRATKADATIVLANVDARIHYLLEVTKLLTVFDVFDSERAAIASFALVA